MHRSFCRHEYSDNCILAHCRAISNPGKCRIKVLSASGKNTTLSKIRTQVVAMVKDAV